MEIEKIKLLKLYEIFSDLQSCIKIANSPNSNNTNDKNIIDFNYEDINNLQQGLNYIDLSEIQTNDLFIQLIILNILILYIFKIIGNELTNVLLKYIITVILKRNFSKDNIESILNLDSTYLLSVYYNTLELLQNKYYSQIISDNIFDISSYKYKDLYDILSMKFIIPKINNICKEAKILNNVNIEEEMNFDNRKININKFIIKFLKEELNIVKEILFLAQYLDDFIVSFI